MNYIYEIKVVDFAGDLIYKVYGRIGVRRYDAESWTIEEVREDYNHEAFAREFQTFCANGNRYGRLTRSQL